MFQSVVAFFAFTPPRTFPGGPRADSRLELLHTCIYATAHQHCSQSNTILPSTTSLLPTIQPPSPQPTPATQYSCPSVLSLVRHKGESKHCYPTDCHSTPQLQISNGTRRLYRCVTEKFSLPETHPEESFQHKKRGQLRHCLDPRQYRRHPLYSGFSTHLPFDRSTGSLVIVTPSPPQLTTPPATTNKIAYRLFGSLLRCVSLFAQHDCFAVAILDFWISLNKEIRRITF